MRLFISTLLLLILYPCFAQNDTIYFDTDWNVSNKEYASFYRPPIKKQGNLFEVKDYFINGQLQSHGFSKSDAEDIWHGKVKYYHTNDSIQAVANYKDNKLEGYFKEYYESGELKSEFLFKENIAHGDHKIYHKNGQLYAIKTFSNGIETGEIRQFYENGNKEFEGQFDANGKKDGLWKAWNIEGDLVTEYRLNHGVIDGKIFGTDPNLNSTYSGEFNKGELVNFTGQNVSPLNGSIFRLEAVDDDGLEIWKMYRDDILITETFIKNKFKVGTWKMYSMDGKNLIRTVSYGDPKNCNQEYIPFPVKRAIPFHSFENKFLTFQLHDVSLNTSDYIDGCLEGVAKEYDLEGSLLKRMTYENGDLVGETVLVDREDTEYASHPIFTKK